MRAVVLAWGSEIVAASLVEAISGAGVPLAVVSLGGRSSLRRARPGMLFGELPWPPTCAESTAQGLDSLLRTWGASEQGPWPILPTEDTGLRLLLEHRERLGRICTFGRAQKLELGGLDKGELFLHLQREGCGDIVAPTVVVESVDQVDRAIDHFGSDCIIKPALKPYSMRLTGMSAKAFLYAAGADRARLHRALARAWKVSSRWVVQTRLSASPEGEAVFWAVRDATGGLSGIAAVVRWKQPGTGGTGCWVVTRHALIPALLPLAERILGEIDHVGLCELEFMVDRDGAWRLVEINPRPWLQIGLAGVAGAPLALQAVDSLLGGRVVPVRCRDGASWVNPGRLLCAALSGDHGPRVAALREAFSAWLEADTVALRGSRLMGVKSLAGWGAGRRF